MRNHSAGGPVGDVIPQRLLWIPSQPRPGKLGAGGVSPKEEEGQGQWMKPLIFRWEGSDRGTEKGCAPSREESPPRVGRGTF